MSYVPSFCSVVCKIQVTSVQTLSHYAFSYQTAPEHVQGTVLELSLTDNRFPRPLQAPTPFSSTLPSWRGDGPDFEDFEGDSDSESSHEDPPTAVGNSSGGSLHLFLEDDSSDEDEGGTSWNYN